MLSAVTSRTSIMKAEDWLLSVEIVMVAFPGDKAFSLPLRSTVTTDSLSDLYVRLLFTALLGRTVQWTLASSPAFIDCGNSVIFTPDAYTVEGVGFGVAAVLPDAVLDELLAA